MKEITGRASAVVPAPIDQCFALVEAVDRYSDWFHEIRDVEVIEQESGGCPLMARVKLHVSQSPFGKNFELVVAVRSEPLTEVQIERVQDGSSDQDRLALKWLLQEGGATQIDFEFYAAVSFLPGLVPLGGVGNLIADHILDAARTALASG